MFLQHVWKLSSTFSLRDITRKTSAKLAINLEDKYIFSDVEMSQNKYFFLCSLLFF